LRTTIQSALRSRALPNGIVGLPEKKRLDRARVRTILAEREMRTGPVIIIEVRGEDAAQIFPPLVREI